MTLCISQKKFSLNAALQEANEFSYHLPSLPENNKLKETIEHFIASLHQHQSDTKNTLSP
jgi:hypothetical protein